MQTKLTREQRLKRERRAARRKARRAPPGTQLGLDLKVRRWGGARADAGRPPSADRAGVPHLSREQFQPRFPLHVVWGMLPHVWNLRTRRCAGPIFAAFEAARDRFGARLTGYTIQGNHLHLMFEAESLRALARALNALATRIARALNRVMGARGPVLRDRYHLHVLRTPREVRAALEYFLENARRHAGAELTAHGEFRDPYTCLGWLDYRRFPRWAERATGPTCVTAPRTWLLTAGWLLG